MESSAFLCLDDSFADLRCGIDMYFEAFVIVFDLFLPSVVPNVLLGSLFHFSSMSLLYFSSFSRKFKFSLPGEPKCSYRLDGNLSLDTPQNRCDVPFSGFQIVK